MDKVNLFLQPPGADLGERLHGLLFITLIYFPALCSFLHSVNWFYNETPEVLLWNYSDQLNHSVWIKCTYLTYTYHQYITIYIYWSPSTKWSKLTNHYQCRGNVAYMWIPINQFSETIKLRRVWPLFNPTHDTQLRCLLSHVTVTVLQLLQQIFKLNDLLEDECSAFMCFKYPSTHINNN